MASQSPNAGVMNISELRQFVQRRNQQQHQLQPTVGPEDAPGRQHFTSGEAIHNIASNFTEDGPIKHRVQRSSVTAYSTTASSVAPRPVDVAMRQPEYETVPSQRPAQVPPPPRSRTHYVDAAAPAGARLPIPLQRQQKPPVMQPPPPRSRTHYVDAAAPAGAPVPIPLQRQQKPPVMQPPPPRSRTHYVDAAAPAGARLPIPLQDQKPPPASVREPDPEALAHFKALYAEQENESDLAEHLKHRCHTATGTTGSLDVEACVEVIETHDITFITTNTGTGKSTLIPKALLERHKQRVVPRTEFLNNKKYTDGTAKDDGFFIVCTQPRRTSTINLAHRVAQLLGDQDSGRREDGGSDGWARQSSTEGDNTTTAILGDIVGYAVRGQMEGEIGETPLMFVTNYTLFLFLLWRQPDDIPFTYVILDEFHERTPEVEVILVMLKLVMLKYPGRMKLILSSATADAGPWSSYFDGVGTVGVFNEDAVMYPVHDFYAEDISKLLGTTPAYPPIRPDGVVPSLHLQQVMLTLRQLLTFLATVAAPQHSILVFLPGRTLVESTCKWVLENCGDQLDPIVWYRDVDLAVIQAALQRDTFTKKKVYLATNIAEVGLTLPDVVFVIDAGMTKKPLVQPHKKYTVAFPPLQLLWADSASATQRRGRVGRVQRGFYFSLMRRADAATLKPTSSCIENAVIHGLVLHTLQIIASPAVTFALCREKPQRASVQYSLFVLQDLGMILNAAHPLAAAERLRISDAATTNDQAVTQSWTKLVEEQLQREQQQEQRRRQDTHASSTVATNTGSTANEERPTTTRTTGGGPSLATPENRLPPATVVSAPHQQSYQITVKGYIVGHSPVDVEAGTNMFLGIQFGVATLGIIVSAVEATKTPFFVPYGLRDRAERAASVRHVSFEMARYRGDLKSDIICSVGVVLDYLAMQCDGLSEEAQEQWCASRHVSRARLMDTVNLVEQSKKQLRAIIPFVDVTDIDVLKAQFAKQAETLLLLNVASHMHWAVYVSESPQHAQRKNYLGHGLFTQMKCTKDASVPTVCPWDRFSVCVPLSLQTTYGRLLTGFATQIAPELFNVVVLVFSPSVLYTAQQASAETESQNPSPAAGAAVHRGYTFFVQYTGVTQVFNCDVLTGQQIIQLRCLQCAQMSIIQVQVEGRVKPGDVGALAGHLASLNTDFGIPDALRARPDVLPTLLQAGLQQLVHRFREKQICARETERPMSANPATCVACRAPVPSVPSTTQSVLVQSSNGIRPLSSMSPEEAAYLLRSIGTGQTENAPWAHPRGNDGMPRGGAAFVENDGDGGQAGDDNASDTSSNAAASARFQFD